LWRPRLPEIALVAALAVLPGCRVARMSGRVVTSMFSSPREVAKNRHPVAPDARLAVLWVGHATALVQMDDKLILTDPVFTRTVGQVLPRLVEPGIDPNDLPPVDVVLISHLHVDHLSLGSLDMIESRVRTLLMPPGGTAYLTDFAFPVRELPTWETWKSGELRITAVPVAHVGWRYGIDADWLPDACTGYVVEYHGLKVYFPGDTAYDQAKFVETGQRFPDIDLALLPIAPIEPREFHRHYHMDPPEALQAFVDLGAKRMVPIHYDTFVTSTDKPGDALRLLGEAKKAMETKYNLGSRVIAPLAVGERRVFVPRGADGAKSEDRGKDQPLEPAEKRKPEGTVPDEDKLE
jgi:L-ascorbate metabolism protein UlaG (beta-lactamase superfamily)